MNRISRWIPAILVALLLVAPIAAQDYRGIDVCGGCHSGTVAGVLNTQHPDKVVDKSEVFTTDGTGESAGCAPGTLIFDPCTAGFDTYVAPYDTYFNYDNVEYALGKHWKQRFLTQKVPADGDATNTDPGNITMLPADEYVIMGIQWNPEFQRWQSYHGPTAENNWYTLAREWNTKCGSCHTTGFNPITNFWVEQSRAGAQHGVTCEACHGPASFHVGDPFGGPKPPFPQNFPGGTEGPPQTAAEGERRLELCGQCHGRGSSAPNGTYGFPFKDDTNENYKPGEVLTDYYTQTTSASSFWPDGSSKKHHQQYIDFLQSSHWTGPDFADKLDCMTCHDSHGGGLVDGGGNALCQSCHTDKVGAGFTAHTGGGGMTEDVLECRGCHMPYMAKSINEWDIRAHTFRVVEPANSLEPSFGGQPNSCTSTCHTADTPGFPLPTASAQSALYNIRFANGGSKTEVGGMQVDYDGNDLFLSWSASMDANHTAYKVYTTGNPSSALINDANWRNVAGEDLDGDNTNLSHTRPPDAGIELECFIIVDEGNNPRVGDAPWGHYSR